jgi:hypothetical protein
MIEKNYYVKFKEKDYNHRFEYFHKLNINDWIDLFEDYYRGEFGFLLKMFDIPKGEDIYSYALISVKGIDTNTKNLIAEANKILLQKYILEKDHDGIIEEILGTIDYLELDIVPEILHKIIKDKNESENIRESAALTLTSVYENSAVSFWESIDFYADNFLIPLYITFYANINPIQGLQKLSIINKKPDDILMFELPVVDSLLQISTSLSYIEDFKKIYKSFPSWVLNFIHDLFDEYTELENLKKKLYSKKVNILDGIRNIGFDLGEININEQLPNEIDCSCRRFIMSLEIGDLKKSVFNESSINIINFDLIKPQKNTLKELQKQIEDIFISDFHYKNCDFNIPDNDEKMYEIDERSMFYKKKSLFLYPYYLDIDRKRHAGVIPYAYQKSMAIVIRKDNKFYEEWVGVRERIKQEFPKSEDWELDLMIKDYDIDTTDWLKRLIADLYRNKGYIHSIRGYVFDAIIQQFIIKNLKADTQIGYLIKPSTAIRNLREELDYFSEYNSNKFLKIKNNPPSILVLDPVEAFGDTVNKRDIIEYVDKTLFDIINVTHGLKIPIGIGYSLYMLPELLKNNTWKRIQDFAINKLSASRVYYYALGIEIMKTEEQKTTKETENQYEIIK